MDDRAEKAKLITRLLNAFPQTTGNYDLLLADFVQHLTPFPIEAVDRAVRRFLGGDVPEQSMKFAPSIPECVAEARRCVDYLEILARPRLPAPTYRGNGRSPFEINQERHRAQHAHLPVLFTNINFDQFRRLSADRQIPEGASWVAALGTIYGPEPKRAAA